MTLPTLSLKTKVIVSVAALAASFAVGRYSVTETPAIKTLIDQKVAQVTQKQEDTHTQTKIVEVKTPDGTDTKTTVISQVKQDETEAVKDTTTHVDQTVTPTKRSTINISALIGTRFVNPDGVPLYGASFNKEFLGPVTVGVWGLNNGTVGVSLGLDF
jgi:hypothetical protein